MNTQSSLPDRPIRLLLADDHRIFRDGLKLLLQMDRRLELVAELDDAGALREQVRLCQPDLLLLDYHMPGGDVSAEVDYLKHRYPDLKVIMLTGSRTALVLQQLINVQADGLLLKDGDAGELRQAIDRVLAGERFIAPEAARLAASDDNDLTKREFEVMKLVCDGLSNKEIANALNLSPKTTDKHRENLMRKLSVNNVAQLIKKAFSLGLSGS